MIRQFRELELHDASLNAVTIDPERREIVLKFATYYSKSEERIHEVVFRGIADLRMDSLELVTPAALEVYSADHSEINGMNHLKLLALSGHSKPSFELSFRYRDLTLSGYQSPI